MLLGDHDVALASIDKVVAGEAIFTDREIFSFHETCLEHIQVAF